MNKKLYSESIFLIILGMLTSLSLPPFNYFIINFFSFTLFFLFLIKKPDQNKKLFFFYGWFFGFGYFITNLYWISISLTFDQNFKFLIPLSVILIPTFLASFYGLISYIFIILKPKKIIPSFLIFSLIFGIIEFVRGSILTGFPWNLIAYSLSDQLNILSINSIMGTYGLNLFCISLFTSPALFIFKKEIKNLVILIFFLICILGFHIFGSFYKEKLNILVKETFDFKIRVIGSNIGLERFYSNMDSYAIIKDLIEISKPEPNEKTIFVWPEGILTNISYENFDEYSSLFKKSFNENHLLLIGTNSESSNNGSKVFFNSLSLYDNELKLLKSYNKINLVPFGEFLPLENVLKKIGLRSLTNNYQSFTSGNKREIIEIKQQRNIIKILPLICYEIIYSGRLFDNPNFDLIINVSEDGWFGDSIGPKQHFTHSIFRAIESGKYVIRSSNNGIAAIINPWGIVEKKINFGQSGYMDLKEISKIQPTIFSKYGNKIFGLLILLYIFLIFSFNKNKNE